MAETYKQLDTTTLEVSEIVTNKREYTLDDINNRIAGIDTLITKLEAEKAKYNNYLVELDK